MSLSSGRHTYNVVVGSSVKQTTKCNDWRQACKVHEEE